MPAGYSGTPLAKKLGFKPGFRCCVIGAPKTYLGALAPLPEGVVFVDEISEDALDLIHIFTAERSELENLFPELKAGLKKNGMLWISWPKKSSRLTTDLAREDVREIGLAGGLVDTKVCAVDEIWSGLKFVYRVVDRAT